MVGGSNWTSENIICHITNNERDEIKKMATDEEIAKIKFAYRNLHLFTHMQQKNNSHWIVFISSYLQVKPPD